MSKHKRRRKRRKDKNGILVVLIILIISAFLLTPLITKTVEKNTHPVKYSNYVEKYCKEYNVPQYLIYATIKVESGFDPNAQSNVGALGLTQIMPETFEWLQTKTGECYEANALKDPEISIKYCAFFYSVLLEHFQNEKAATAAYHAGMNQVDLWLSDKECSSDGISLDNIPSKATAHYVNKIENAIKIYSNHYKEEIIK